MAGTSAAGRARMFSALATALAFLVVALGALGAVGVRAAGSERQTADLPDDLQGAQVHVVYAIPSDGEDRRYDVDGTLARSLDSMQRWMKSQTGGRGFRIDTAQGAYDISFAKLPRPGAAYAAMGASAVDGIAEDLGKVGLIFENVITLIVFDGPNNDTCGSGNWPGSAGAIYLRSRDGSCEGESFAAAADAPPGDRESGMAHEILHAAGFVANCGASADGNGHTYDDPRDLMWAIERDADKSHGWEPILLDPGHDDYFGHGRRDCPDLARSAYLERGGSELADPTQSGGEAEPAIRPSRPKASGRTVTIRVAFNEPGKATLKVRKGRSTLGSSAAAVTDDTRPFTRTLKVKLSRAARGLVAELTVKAPDGRKLKRTYRL